MKLGTHTKKNMLNSKKVKADIQHHFQRWPLPPSFSLLPRHRSAIVMKVGTHAKKNMQKFQKRETGSLASFSKMAAAIVKFIAMP
jgi:hypothetical protein